MKSPKQARANAARQRQAQSGEPYAAALAAVRRDRLERRDQAYAEVAPEPVPDFHDRPVPPELIKLVRHYAHRITRYLHGAMVEGRHDEDFAEWQRLTLYKLTDALEYFHLLIGAIAAYLRDCGVPASHLRRCLQVPDDRHVQAFYTPRVEELLAGLTGRDTADESATQVWRQAGAILASEGLDQEAEDTLEVFLNALFVNFPDDDRGFDHLPERLRQRAVALLPHRSVPPVGSSSAG